jgi:hypothetical protein
MAAISYQNGFIRQPFQRSNMHYREWRRIKPIKVLPLIGIMVMAVLSFANFLGARIAGTAVIIGVLLFFVMKRREKQSYIIKMMIEILLKN